MILFQIPAKRRYGKREDSHLKQVFEYKLNEIRVCKQVYCSVLGVSKDRVTYAVKQKKREGIMSPDKRGRREPSNKTPIATIENIRLFLSGFPKYRSHYSNSERLYFSPDLTIKKLYQLYCEKYGQQYKIGKTFFRKCLKDYNISIYIPKTDTCAKCDSYKIKIKENITENEKKIAKEEHQKHLKRAEDARTELKNRGTESKIPESKLLCFTFDLQKTQPVPYLNTSVVYYKRQLWMYNLGINTRHNNKGFMCVWDETSGKKGSNEVASSISSFFDHVNFSDYDYIHTFSDCCGGQNRNKNIISFFIFICENTHIKSWSHTFMESGHSFLPNDTDFGKIEKAKNCSTGLYSPEQWISLIENASYQVIPMKGKFLGVNNLQSYLNFRALDNFGKKLSWLSLKKIQIRKDSPLTMKFKYTNDLDEQYRTINLRRRKQKSLKSIKLPTLYNDPIKISLEKYKDLQSLLQYIPPIHHSFYKNLAHKKTKSKEKELLPDELIDE